MKKIWFTLVLACSLSAPFQAEAIGCGSKMARVAVAEYHLSQAIASGIQSRIDNAVQELNQAIADLVNCQQL